MKKLFTAAMAVSFMFVASCGKEENALTNDTTGKWIGFVVDGKTGTTLDFFGDDNGSRDKDSVDQIYAIADGKVKTAKPCDRGDANDSNGISRAGCFQIEGLPIGVDVPVFVQRDGYTTFDADIYIDVLADGNDTDVVLADPSVLGNVRLFPNGSVNDITIELSAPTITDFSTVVVSCVYDDADNAFDIIDIAGSSNYLSPNNSLPNVITTTSNVLGEVVIDAAGLTAGATYRCTAQATGLIDNLVVYQDTPISFVAGIDGETALGLGLLETP